MNITAVRRLFQESAIHYIEEKLIKNEFILFLKTRNPVNYEILEREEDFKKNLDDKIMIITRLASTTIIKPEFLGLSPFELKPEHLLVPYELIPHLESELNFLKILFKFCEIHRQIRCPCNTNTFTQIR